MRSPPSSDRLSRIEQDRQTTANRVDSERGRAKPRPRRRGAKRRPGLPFGAHGPQSEGGVRSGRPDEGARVVIEAELDPHDVAAGREACRYRALGVVRGRQLDRRRVDADASLARIGDLDVPCFVGFDDAAPRDLERKTILPALTGPPQEVEPQRIEEGEIPVLWSEVDDAVDARRFESKQRVLE